MSMTPSGTEWRRSLPQRRADRLSSRGTPSWTNCHLTATPQLRLPSDTSPLKKDDPPKSASFSEFCDVYNTAVSLRVRCLLLGRRGVAALFVTEMNSYFGLQQYDVWNLDTQVVLAPTGNITRPKSIISMESRLALTAL